MVTKSIEEWYLLKEDYFFSKSLRPDTEWSYTKVMDSYIRFIGGKKGPNDIQKHDVLLWRRNAINQNNLSPHTWNNKVAHMRALFNHGMKSGFLHHEENPFNEVRVRSNKKRKKTLSKSQLTRVYLIMQQFQDSDDGELKNALKPIWYWMTVLDTLRYTGMRLNQIKHIKLRDIQIKTGAIALCYQGSKNHDEWLVPIVKQLRPRLIKLLEMAERHGAEPGDYLFDVRRFTHPEKADALKGVLPHNQQTRSFFNRLSKECGFRVSAHRFRHTLASVLMVAPDRNLQLVRSLLGHRSVSTTMEYIDINMDVASKTLETELALHTDLCVENDLHSLTL